VAGALVAFRRRAHRPLVAAALVALTAAQLLWLNAASPLDAEPASTYSALATPFPDEARAVAILQGELARRHAEGARPRVEFLGVDGAWQNAAMIYGWEDTLGYNPLRMADYSRAVGAGESSTFTEMRSYPDTFRGYNSRLAALLGLEYLVLRKPIADMPRDFPRPRASLLYAGASFFLYRLDGPSVPRAFVATSLVSADAAQTMAAGSLPPYAIGRQALIEDDDAPRLADQGLLAPDTGAPAGMARITAYADDRVTLDVDTRQAGLVVLHDLFYPGWTARVDGVPAPVLRADLLFRGVEVGAGHHTVEFAFHPLSLANLASIVRRTE
ncbi:MAG: hypothetical protein INR64_18655, partial [Caulobacteraceae bacterium]|nr:hypothetical protein [Caulobacter sp.]